MPPTRSERKLSPDALVTIRLASASRDAQAETVADVTTRRMLVSPRRHGVRLQIGRTIRLDLEDSTARELVVDLAARYGLTISPGGARS